MTRRQDDSHPGTADPVPVLTGGSDIGETEATEPFPAEVPAAGSDVSLLPADDPGVAILGTLLSWSASPTLLVITATVELDDPLDAALVRARVWVSARTESGTLVVVTALANCSAGSRIVDLTGVQALAREPRRRAVRAPVTRPASVSAGGHLRHARTLDLSRSGCRVLLDQPEAVGTSLTEGVEVAVTIDLDEATVVRAPGQVVRIDHDAGQVMVRFLDLDAADGARVDSLVFTSLVRSAW